MSKLDPEKLKKFVEGYALDRDPSKIYMMCLDPECCDNNFDIIAEYLQELAKCFHEEGIQMVVVPVSGKHVTMMTEKAAALTLEQVKKIMEEKK